MVGLSRRRICTVLLAIGTLCLGAFCLLQRDRTKEPVEISQQIDIPLGLLTNALGTFSERKTGSGWHIVAAHDWGTDQNLSTTNAFILNPFGEPIGKYPGADNAVLPYVMIFYIRFESNQVDSTIVRVRFLRSDVIKGTDFGWHLGPAISYGHVPPRIEEPYKLLLGITNEALKKKPAGI
jgi:hypothetical protein